MKSWKTIIVLVILISGCTSLHETQPFTSEDVSSIVLAKKYSEENGPEEITDKFNLEGSIHAVFAFRSKKIIKGRNSYHKTRIEYYQDNELLHGRDYKFNMKNNIWYVIMPTFTITLGIGEFVGKFYVDGNLVDTKRFTISSDN